MQAPAGAGSILVIFDCSGGQPGGAATTIAFPPRQDLAACCPPLQCLIISIAARKVDRDRILAAGVSSAQ